MKLLLFLVLSVVLRLPTASAQEARARRGDPLPTQGTSHLYITPMPGQIPSSLKELCDLSTLIIDGTVKATIPPRDTGTGALETDAVIAIGRTLKGPASLNHVVISQRGGTTGDRAVVPAQYSLVEPGERYILFLTEDKRPNIPEVATTKRYLVVGIWSGLFRFEEGRMRVNARTPDPLRSRYEGLSLEQITGEISDVLRP